MFQLLEHITQITITALDLRTSFLNHGWDYVFQRFREGGRVEGEREGGEESGEMRVLNTLMTTK